MTVPLYLKRCVALLGLVIVSPALADQVDSRLILNHTQYRFQEMINGSMTDSTLRNNPMLYMGPDGTAVLQAETNTKYDSVYYGDDERIGMYFVNTPGGGSTQRILHDREEAPGLPGSYIMLEGLADKSFHIAADGTFSYLLDVEDGFNYGPSLYQGTSSSQNLVTQVGRTIGSAPIVSIGESLGTSPNYIGLDIQTTTEHTIYVGNPTELTRLVGSSDIGTVGGSAVTELYFGDDERGPFGGISDDGAAIFRVETADANSHVFYSDGGAPQQVASVGDIVTGAGVDPSYNDISHIWQARVGDGGRSLVAGRLASDTLRDFVMYGTPGNMKIIASEGSTDGLPAGYEISGGTSGPIAYSVPSTVFLDNGDLILPIELRETGTSSLFETVMRYDLSTEQLQPLVWTGMDASDLPGGNPEVTSFNYTIRDDNSTNFAINDRGDIVFYGTYEYDDPVNAGARLSRSGLFLLDSRTDLLSMILEEGVDELDFGGGFETIDTLQYAITRSVGTDTRGKFNNRGDLVVRAFTASDEQAFFVVNVGVVPEPASLTLSCLFALTWLATFRRSRG